MTRAPWRYKLQLGDVFYADDLDFETKRDIIVERIKDSEFYDPFHDGYLEALADELSGVADEDEFNDTWDEFHDYADDNRIWIETLKCQGGQ